MLSQSCGIVPHKNINIEVWLISHLSGRLKAGVFLHHSLTTYFQRISVCVCFVLCVTYMVYVGCVCITGADWEWCAYMCVCDMCVCGMEEFHVCVNVV